MSASTISKVSFPNPGIGRHVSIAWPTDPQFGCVISATLIAAILFEGWPAARLSSAAGRVLTLALTVLMAFALHRALASYADGVHWTRATPDEWITTAALSYAAVGIILHVGIGLRWPFAFDPDTPPA